MKEALLVRGVVEGGECEALIELRGGEPTEPAGDLQEIAVRHEASYDFQDSGKRNVFALPSHVVDQAASGFAEVVAHGLGNAHLPEIEEQEALLQQIGRLFEQQRRAAETSAGAHRAF